MTVQCCQCERIRHGGGWKQHRVAVDERVSYTYCPSCLRLFRRVMWRRRHAGHASVAYRG